MMLLTWRAVMTTPRDLFLLSVDVAAGRPVDRGDLSLGLAGAEAIDLLDARVITLDDDRIVPYDWPTLGDRQLNEAASSIVQQAPYESVSDWLWRRGRHLSAAYQADLEADGTITRKRHRRWLVFRTTRTVLVDSPERRWAADRLAADDPVLGSLGAAVGICGSRAEDAPSVADDAVATVLTAVDDAIEELAAERQRRAQRLDKAAEFNRERGY